MNMYRQSPVTNHRSKGFKTKHFVQLCLLIAVCFWLIFQVKRSHDKKKEFDSNEPKNVRVDEVIKFGRKDLLPKLEETSEMHEETQEDDDEHEENRHGEEEQDEQRIEQEKDDGGGGGDDEIDENELEKSNMEIDREEVDIVDEDTATEESDEKENEEKDDQSQTGSSVDHDEDGHTHETREEHYKADDVSSAVITHDAENEYKNGTTLDNKSTENVGLVDNSTLIQEKVVTSLIDSGPPSTTTLMTKNSISVGYQFDSNATLTEITQAPSNATEMSEILKPNESTAEEDNTDPSRSANLESKNEDSSDPTHLEEEEALNDLERLPEIETEDGNSQEAAAE